MDMPKRDDINSPGRKIAVMTASAFIEDESRDEATAIRALRLLSSWAILLPSRYCLISCQCPVNGSSTILALSKPVPTRPLEDKGVGKEELLGIGPPVSCLTSSSASPASIRILIALSIQFSVSISRMLLFSTSCAFFISSVDFLYTCGWPAWLELLKVLPCPPIVVPFPVPVRPSGGPPPPPLPEEFSLRRRDMLSKASKPAMLLTSLSTVMTSLWFSETACSVHANCTCSSITGMTSGWAQCDRHVCIRWSYCFRSSTQWMLGSKLSRTRMVVVLSGMLCVMDRKSYGVRGSEGKDRMMLSLAWCRSQNMDSTVVLRMYCSVQPVQVQVLAGPQVRPPVADHLSDPALEQVRRLPPRPPVAVDVEGLVILEGPVEQLVAVPLVADDTLGDVLVARVTVRLFCRLNGAGIVLVLGKDGVLLVL
ncbi:hypothetical protein VP1G_11047 [Cytospora mali]|uniref:Uncharacterized protein n=1 Tax=Cytospora mali TaxID=578113 RepID=A0A194V5K9_CYTMA|nr:hypothetical protein VP1G_11047 [Valsa mali var. pyri (nom. inval.)]